MKENVDVDSLVSNAFIVLLELISQVFNKFILFRNRSLVKEGGKHQW